MKKEDIVIGTTYRIREWDDMVQEFGVDGEGDIDVSDPTVFASDMNHLCGTEYAPTAVDDDGDCLPLLHRFVINTAMLEPARKPVGMYGETPRIQVGKFSICRQDDNSVWLEIDGEEGQQISDTIMEAELQAIFDRRF